MSRDRDTLVVWMVAIALAAPTVLVRYPPTTDLTMHESMLALLVHRGEPGWSPSGLYVASWGHANQLFYALAWPLAHVLSTALTCKLIAGAAVAGVIVATERLARHVSADPLLALAVAPVAVGWLYYQGFVANLLGLAILVASLPWLDRFVADPTPRRLGLVALLFVVLHFAHEGALVSGCVVLAVFALAAPRDGRIARRLAPLALGLGLGVAESLRCRAIETPFAKLFSRSVAFDSLGRKLSHLPGLVAGDVEPAWILCLIPVAAVAVGVALRDPVRRRPHGGEPPRPRSPVGDARYLLAAGALFAAYLAAPYSLNFGFFFYARFLAPALVVLVVALGARFPAGLRGRRWVRVVCGLAPLATLLVAAPEMAESSAQQQALGALYPRIDRESAVLVARFGAVAPSPYERISSANRVLAERGGRMLFSFTEYPISPLQIAPGHLWEDTLLRTYATGTALRPALELERFRYVLVFAPDANVAARVVRAFSPWAGLVATSGDWTLLEASVLPAPLLGADLRMPSSPPPTVGELDARR